MAAVNGHDEPGARSGFESDWLVQARHPASERFHEILRELGALHDRKQLDYGRRDDPFANVRASEEWGVPAWIGSLIRLNDKVRRLQALSLSGHLWNESAEDSLRDIAVYAVIALVLLEEMGYARDALASSRQRDELIAVEEDDAHGLGPVADAGEPDVGLGNLAASDSRGDRSRGGPVADPPGERDGDAR